jgi:GTP-binding protein EngB required for normal cell division
VENNDYKISIDELLEKRKYNPNYIPSKENIIFTIQDKHIGSLQNFIIFSGLPKAGKSTFICAMISSVFNTYDIFSMKLHTPHNRAKICLIDTESSDYDFYRTINKIKGFADINDLPANFDAFQVREDSSNAIKQMIERYLELNRDCAILIVDGLLDLLVNYNDEKESSLLTKWLKKITKHYNILLISVLHQSKSNLATTGHIGSASDRFAQSTLDITKDKDKNTYVLSSRFMRSDSDFEPITLMNFNGLFQQIETEKQKNTGKKASDIDEIESKRLLHQIITMPMPYNDISSEIIERTATSKAFAKNLIKLWISKNYIVKDNKNNYKIL